VLLRTNTKGCKESQLDRLLLRVGHVRSRKQLCCSNHPKNSDKKVKPSPEAVVVVKGHEAVQDTLGIGRESAKLSAQACRTSCSPDGTGKEGLRHVTYVRTSFCREGLSQKAVAAEAPGEGPRRIAWKLSVCRLKRSSSQSSR